MIDHPTTGSKITPKHSSRAWKGSLKPPAAPASKRPSAIGGHRVLAKTGPSPAGKGSLKRPTTISRSRLPSLHLTEKLSLRSSESSSDVIYSDKDQGIFSFYQMGDGSAEDPDNIPQRYLEMTNHDRSTAIKAVQSTLKWREENGINNVLNEPHVNFDIFKAIVPHFYLGRDVKGHVMYVQLPARLNTNLLKVNGLTYDDVLHHAIFIQEYLRQIVEADNPKALTTTIIDVGDLYLSDFTKKQDQLQVLKQMVTTFEAHFPMRRCKTIIVNAPSWFNLLWKLVKPILRESTRDVIEISAKGEMQDAILHELLGKETSKALPDSCWSKPKKRISGTLTSTAQLQMEMELRDFVISRIEATGETMAPVLS